MFTSLRRAPSSIRWRIVSSATSQSTRLNSPSTARLSAVPSTLLSPKNDCRAFSVFSRHSQNAATNTQEPPTDSDIDDATASGPITQFADLDKHGLVDPVLVRTLTRTMGLKDMTEVQSLTLNEALKGKDVLAQAKTGTGKTIGFLLPILQNILQDDPALVKGVRKPKYGQRAEDVRAIIISPTRELAEQIAAEAKKLTQGTGIVVQTAVGGTQKSFHLRQMQSEGCHILVGTPGRLKDIFSDRHTGVSAPRLSALVLDEADRLLDQGFWPEIQAIQDLLPSKAEKDRQTLMFSATVSQEVVKLVRSVMKPDLHYVRTVQDNEEPTHDRVKQSIVTVPSLENLLPTLLELCQRECDAATTGNIPGSSSRRPFKAIVYFNATAETTLASSIFMSIRRGTPSESTFSRSAASFNGTHLTSTRVYEIHSRLSQRQRTSAADNFRAANTGILMSSDVTARGMDFPGVTHVIQVGMPSDRETYIHRLGRTARAGQEGEGWLILPSPHLNEARQRLGKLPLIPDHSLEAAKVDFSTAVADAEPQSMTKAAKEWFDAVAEGADRVVEPEDASATYMAVLGTHQWLKNKEWLISALNRLAKVQWRMSEPPALGHGLVMKMGLRGIPGLRIGSGPGRSGGGRDGGRPRSFGEVEDARGGGRGGYGDRQERTPRFADRDERAPRFGGGGGRSSGFGDRSSGGSRFGDRNGGGSRFGDRSGGGDRSSRFSDRDERGGGGGGRGGFGGRGRTGDIERGRGRDRF